MKKIKINDEGSWKISVIPLYGGKFYIGYGDENSSTVCLEADWVKDHGIDMTQKIQNFSVDSDHEAFWECFKRTIEMMELLGIDQIRSDVFPEANLSCPTLAYIEHLFKHKIITSYTDVKCSRCHRTGHLAEVCYSETRLDGSLIDIYSNTSSSSSSDSYN